MPWALRGKPIARAQGTPRSPAGLEHARKSEFTHIYETCRRHAPLRRINLRVIM